MPRVELSIKTRDGVAPASFFTPSTGSGPWPGVIFFMDGLGIRPSMWEMGQRLADMGYAVLLPDLYYRHGTYARMVPSEVFSDPKKREKLMEMVHSLDRDKKVSDSGAYIESLASRPEVKKGSRFGSTGYCMGGNTSIVAAGAYPDKFAANASFHGGGLATDNADSPHLFVKGIKARVYVAGAIEDNAFTDAQKAQLEKALTDAKVDHVVETYEGALHGWAVPDMPVFNEKAAERHWAALKKLFSETL